MAAYFFVRSRHLVAAVLPHAFCNLLGPPVVPHPGAPHRQVILLAFLGGAAGFLCLLWPLTDPSLYSNAMR